MAQRTVTNTPTFSETQNAAQQTVRPEIQPAVQNFLAQQQLTDARGHQALADKISQAKLNMDQLKLDPEIAQLKAGTAQTEAATALAGRKAPSLPSTALKGLLHDDVIKHLPADIPQDSFDALVRLAGVQQTAEARKNAPEEKLKLKLRTEAPKAKAALDNTIREYDNMINEANAIKNDPELGNATGLFSYAQAVPGTNAKKVGARLDTLKAKTLLNTISSLKQLSATGATGFGALSEKEGKALQDSVSALDPKQKTVDFQASIDRFNTEMQARKQGLLDTYQSVYGDASAGTGTEDPNAAKKAALKAKLGL